jgi:hypothetical protein
MKGKCGDETKGCSGMFLAKDGSLIPICKKCGART